MEKRHEDLYSEARGEDESFKGCWEEVKENLDVFAGVWSGIGVRTAHYIVGYSTDTNLFKDVFNPLYLDKLFHGAFSYGISGLTWRSSEVASYRMEQLNEEYGDSLEGVFDYLKSASQEVSESETVSRNLEHLLESSEEFMEGGFEQTYKTLSDPRFMTAVSFGAVGAFSIIKEFLMDKNPDGLDIGANYLGMSLHVWREHVNDDE
ncbi:MAG: hypothetical protein SVV03_06575 [Candidatus Nanohaloarchaea archaeon]|nr:hypothetical protein [Candidatus Nanohaloarchaea archaeon]